MILQTLKKHGRNLYDNIMKKPNVLVLNGYGINCDVETQYAFALDPAP